MTGGDPDLLRLPPDSISIPIIAIAVQGRSLNLLEASRFEGFDGCWGMIRMYLLESHWEGGFLPLADL